MVFKLSALIFATIVGLAVPPLLLAALIGWFFLIRSVRARVAEIRAHESGRVTSARQRELDAAFRFVA